MTKVAPINKEKTNLMESAMTITIGKATVCYNTTKRAWVKPGGELIHTEKKAKAFCKKLAELM